MKTRFILHSLFLSLILLSGCGTASTLTTKPNETNFKSAYIQIEKTPSEFNIGLENISVFEQKLTEELYFKNDCFFKGDGLILSYKFLNLNPGDRLRRFASLGNSKVGEGGLIIEVTFKKANGKVVGIMEAHAQIKGGLLGGSIDEALQKAASQISTYAKLNFK